MTDKTKRSKTPKRKLKRKECICNPSYYLYIAYLIIFLYLLIIYYYFIFV